MESKINPDIRSELKGFEQQAFSLLRKGNYSLAEQSYRFMLKIVFEAQESENIRIHKGGYFHQIGFTLVLQGGLNDALRNFLLAYVEDTLNVPFGHEDDADGSPAARVLNDGFNLRANYFEEIKRISHTKKSENVLVKNPEEILGQYLIQIGVVETDLLSLCDPVPTQDDVRRRLIVNLTPKAQNALNTAITERSNQVLQRAALLAKDRGHPDQVTERDIIDAVKELEGQAND